MRNPRSSAKQFNPSREVRIEPRCAADGSATWHVAIAPSAMRKLAKAAGVNEVDLSWLREPLEFMMFELQCHKSSRDRAPSWPNRIKHLRATSCAVRKLEALLRPEWISMEMGRFETRKLQLKMLGSRGGVHIETRADGKRARDWMRAASVVEGDVKRDVEGVRRIRSRLPIMIDRFEHARAEGRLAPADGARNPIKQYIGDNALRWWMRLGHGPERTDQFIAFAETVYRLAGFALRPAAIREQLKSAVKRRGVSGDEQRSERRV